MLADQPLPPAQNPSSPATVHVRVEGRVQGVGFRYYVLERAQVLGVRGWVRNRWDESVELVAQAPREVLERFLGLVQRGSRSAYVSRMETEWLPDPGQSFVDFHIRPTE
jgi:acylphosphatase